MRRSAPEMLDLPIPTMGKGGGHLNTDQSLDFPKTPRQVERLANLYPTFLRGIFDLPITTVGTAPTTTSGAAVPTNAFGAGTDVIPEILA